jgi:hypothetical protein
LNMWSSSVRGKGTTQVMYFAKLKDVPKGVKKTFSMVLERFFFRNVMMEGEKMRSH